MRARARIVPMVGVGLSVLSLGIVLGLGSPTLAQKDTPSPKGEAEKPAEPKGDVPKGESFPPPVPEPAPDMPLALPPTETTPPVVPTEAKPAKAGALDLGPPAASPAPTPAAPSTPAAPPAASPVPTPASSPVPTSSPAPTPAAPPPSVPAKPDQDLGVAQAASPGPSAGDDPEKAAQEFMERARREADAAIKSLNAEAESLRTRLQKVESGLKRWRALQTALEANSKDVNAKRTWRQGDAGEAIPAEPASMLEPTVVPRTKSLRPGAAPRPIEIPSTVEPPPAGGLPTDVPATGARPPRPGAIISRPTDASPRF